jgi:hypothetical protein
VDPKHPLNAIIQDIELAPRNARGMVEYVTDVEQRRPLLQCGQAGAETLSVDRGQRP